MKQIRMSELLAPVFAPVHTDIRRGGHAEYWLYGGRGSGKSSFVSIEIVLGMMKDPQANALVVRRVRYEETLYKCLGDHTAQPSWTPPDAPSLWVKVVTSDTGVPLPWQQPDNTNPYMKGDKVTHKGKTWVSAIDNNVWEPGVYGWEVVM